jgi:imidazoleglycerol-phosphate dehydratase
MKKNIRKKRTAQFSRTTRETDIKATLTIDGKGQAAIKTGIGILDHMLELFSFHGLFDLTIKATGDLAVDIHHTNEDIGIVLGEVFKKALLNKQGIKRFGWASVPMEEVLARVTVDVSGRGGCICTIPSGASDPATQGETYTFGDMRHFFDSFAKHLGANVHITFDAVTGDLHTSLEPAFKAMGLALDQATQIDPRRKGVPSTKGVID